MKPGIKKAHTFFTGNGTSHRKHITRYLCLSSCSIYITITHRFHYKDYLTLCASKNITAKAHPPENWKDDKRWVLSPYVMSVWCKYCIQNTEKHGWLHHCMQEATRRHEGWFERVSARVHCWWRPCKFLFLFFCFLHLETLIVIPVHQTPILSLLDPLPMSTVRWNRYTKAFMYVLWMLFSRKSKLWIPLMEI